MTLTYRELIENLKAIPDDRLDDPVTIYVSRTAEFYPLVEDYPFRVTTRDRAIPGCDGLSYLVI